MTFHLNLDDLSMETYEGNKINNLRQEHFQRYFRTIKMFYIRIILKYIL